MPRRPRLKFADFPWHVTQRGVDRLPCFADDSDRLRYWIFLKEASERYGCAVHAYALMPNHVHLLVQASEWNHVSSMMKAVGQRHAQWFNGRYARTGPLWEGRFRADLVDSDRYLLTCHRYIELNPVRAGLVERAGDFCWSSFRANALGKADDVVSPHPLYMMLGPDSQTRQHAYRVLFEKPVPEEDVIAIRRGAIGPIPRRGPGRPRKTDTQDEKGVRPLF